MVKGPDIKILTTQQLDELLERVRPQVQAEDFKLIEGVIRSLKWIQEMLAQSSLTLKRLRRWLFGAQTEKTNQVLPPPPAGPAQGSATSPVSAKEPAAGQPTAPGKRKGHGRLGVKDYPGAKHIRVAHHQHRVGDACQFCKKGRLYQLPDPAPLIHIVARPPFSATVYDLEKLRCSGCGALFTAKPPPEAGTQKYDPNVGCMVGLLCYGSGLPLHCLEQLQQGMGVPMPAATTWELAQSAAQDFKPVFEQLKKEAAGGEVLHNDDTGRIVLSLLKVIAKEQEVDSTQRTGIFTSCIVARAGDHQIALYFTGRKHAGENLNDLLQLRDPTLPEPIQMCDGLSRNLPKEFKTILANCLTHARREYVDVVENFPQECRLVLEYLREVYANDAECKNRKLSPEARLALHQEKSKPVMDKLHEWMEAQLHNKLVEPNSGLGKAINYMLKRWEALTLFLRKTGAPLDNNICERAIKKAIRHRKNSLFFKTTIGAQVGDLFMSLIHSCELNSVNPFDYLTTLRRNLRQVKEKPHLWLPWNFLKASDTS
jgi:transposase